MRNINEILDSPYRDRGAYRVPEEYFSTLDRRIMDAVDAADRKQRKPKIWQMPHFRYAVAASFAALLIGLGAAYFDSKGIDGMQTAEYDDSEAVTDDYVKECMDYAMLDNNDVYMYVAGE